MYHHITVYESYTVYMYFYAEDPDLLVSAAETHLIGVSRTGRPHTPSISIKRGGRAMNFYEQ